jgi:hypothetical protein
MPRQDKETCDRVIKSIRKHQRDQVSQDKTLQTAKINAVIRVHNIGIPKLEVFLRHRQTTMS